MHFRVYWTKKLKLVCFMNFQLMDNFKYNRNRNTFIKPIYKTWNGAFNTSNEGTDGLGISYSSRKMRGKVLNFVLLTVRLDWKAKYSRSPPFSEFYGILNENENDDCITWRLLWHSLPRIFTCPQSILQNPTSFKCFKIIVFKQLFIKFKKNAIEQGISKTGLGKMLEVTWSH
jgi:hypothetical protein